MLFYPQLTSGAITQYPVTRHNIRRTVVNLLPDGTCIRTADDGAATVSWELVYSHLVLDELKGIQRLFAAACGEWQTFTFTDPTDNLLQWSEDLTQAVWKSDPLLSASSGVQDPNGGTAAVTLTNASQINQQIAQTLQIPAGNQYCLSVYLRCDQATAVNLVASNADSQAQSTILAAPGLATGEVLLPVDVASRRS